MVEVQARTGSEAEEMVVARMAAGERAALSELYASHRGPLLGYLRSFVDDPGLAEEVLQDTLYAAWTGAAAYGGRASVRAWLLGIARRRAHDALRRRAIRVVTGDVLESLPNPEPELESLALAGAEIERVRTALARLRPMHREVLVLNFMQELPYREIAVVLGIPIGTVMSRLHHAKRALRAAIESEGRS